MSRDRESEVRLPADAPAAAAFLLERRGRLAEPVAGEAGVWWAEVRPASEGGETYMPGSRGLCTPRRRRR
jgi:hypothetical protein